MGEPSGDGAMGLFGHGAYSGQYAVLTKCLPYDAIVVKYVLPTTWIEHSNTNVVFYYHNRIMVGATDK